MNNNSYKILKFYKDGYKQEENFRGKNMSKMLKTIALLLVIAAVVFVAGCANKSTPNVTQGASEHVTSQTPVSSEGVNQSEVTANVPANISVTGNNATNVNEVTENNTSAAVSATTAFNIEQSTGNTTAATSVNKNSVERHRAVAQSQQQYNATETAKQ